MALSDLKSDLSKFRKTTTTSITVPTRKEVNKSFSTTPLEKMVVPSVRTLPPSKNKVSQNLQNISMPSGHHLKGHDVKKSISVITEHFSGSKLQITSSAGTHNKSSLITISKDSKSSGRFNGDTSILNLDKITLISPTGRHNTGIEITSQNTPNGRHIKGTDAKNTSEISGRHIKGTDAKNTSEISGRHIVDESKINLDKIILTNPSGRHTLGTDAINSSQLSGRHESDNSSLNNDNIVLTNPGGRHELGTNVLNSSQLSGRHENDNSSLNVDTINLTTLGGRHELSGNGLSQYQSPGQVDFFSNINATGFTSNLALGDKTKFDVNSSKLNEYGNLKIVNFINDVDAWGFRKKMPLFETSFNIQSITLQQQKYPLNPQFIIKQENTNVRGVDKTKFTYPESIKGGRLWRVGNAKITSQLGDGTYIPTPAAFAMVGHHVKMQLTGTGYHEGRMYKDVTRNKVSPIEWQYQQENSPSLLQVSYNKYNLQSDSVNYTYIKHPLILRGIQRSGADAEPQRWGLERKFGFDDGLIRGGMLTAVERMAIDTARIAKWMASPKGLLWIVKQAGLGLMNPLVEKTSLIAGLPSTILGIQQTRIHTGVTSLLSVAGNALGIHISTHGIPFANAPANYETVTKANNSIEIDSGRLKLITEDLFGGKNDLPGVVNTIATIAQKLGIGGNNIPIARISGIGGPKSMMGIGATIHRRYTNTEDGRRYLKPIDKNTPPLMVLYGIKSQYASQLSINAPRSYNIEKEEAETQRKLNGSDSNLLLTSFYSNIDIETGKNFGIRSYQSGDASTPITKEEISRHKSIDKYPFRYEGDNDNIHGPGQFGTSKARPKVSPIKQYATLAYSQLSRKNITIDQNFIQDTNVKRKDGDSVPNKPKVYDYTLFNLNSTFGYGEQGKVGDANTNRSDYTKKAAEFRGDKVNLINAKIGKDGKTDNKNIYKDTDNKIFKDFIEFYFTGPKNIAAAGVSEEILVFRASITDFQDQYQPQWQSYQMLGRADKVHMYESWGRSISFNFKAMATSREELKPIWRKLNYLASWTAPKYGGDRFTNPMIRITLGNLFQQTPCFINGLTYTVDENTPWEINLENDPKLMQVPHGVNASIQLTMIMDYRPQWDGRAYSLSPNGINSDSDSNWLKDSSVALNSAPLVDRSVNDDDKVEL